MTVHYSKIGQPVETASTSNSPYYDLVPRDPVENLKWRIRCRERAMVDKKFRDVLWQAAMEDLCFFMAAFCWGYDPRARFKIVPFIPYLHQQNVFVAMDEAVDTAEREERAVDVIVDKSRAQGGSFGYLWVDLRRWLRDPMFSAGYVTRNEDLIDSKSDSSTVLWKVAWAIERLPFWMKPNYERHLGQHTFINHDNGSLLRGYSAGQDVAAGGRCTVFTVDEAGARDFVAGGKDEAVQESIQDVSNCLAKGTLVVTDAGLIPIEDIGLFHRVWDGTMWVSHDGCIYKGERETIPAYGIRLTPDHQVLTTNGWEHASNGRFERARVRLPEGYREKWIDLKQACMAVPLPVRRREDDYGAELAQRTNQELRMLGRRSEAAEIDYAREVENADVPCMGFNDSEVYQPKLQALSQLRRSRYSSVRSVDDVRELPCGHGGSSEGTNTGSQGQQWQLRAGQLQMEHSRGTTKQHANQCNYRNAKRNDEHIAGGEGVFDLSQWNTVATSEGSDRKCASRTACANAVYDIVNCGPQQRFAVIDNRGQPLLVHNCVRLVSARYTDAGVFHNACENPDTAKNGVHLVLDWKDHPIQGKNSYIVRDNVPFAIKPEEQAEVNQYHKDHPDLRTRLERKGFKYEGVPRSPWYDSRCLRPTATPRLVASQYDRNPRGAVGKVFSSDLLDRMKKEHCKGPVWVGNPVFDSETCKLTGLIPREDGTLKLWFRPGIDDSPPLGPFTAGADIASGGVSAHATNSVLTALDNRTGEQVLEYAIKGLEPRPFARRVVGLCMWLRNALLGWEDSGVSGGFAKEVMEVLYYGNVFFRNVTQLGSQKKSRKPGWPCQDADKADMFEQFALSMENKSFTPRSENMIVECGEYEWDGSKIVHVPTKNRGLTEKNHADRAISAAGCWLVFNTDIAIDKIDTSDEIGQTPEYGSFLWREQQEQRGVKSGSPRYGIRDIIRR